MFSRLSLSERMMNSSLLYLFYFYLGSFFVSFLRLFARTNSKLIVFMSFGGRKFDDSPKAIYDQMIKDKRFQGYQFLWAFNKPNEFQIPVGKTIKTDNLKYYLTILKARVWITNSSMERGLSFKGKNTFYFNTWHGSPIKFMGTDIPKNSKSFGEKIKCRYNVMTSQGKQEAEIFSRVYNIPIENFRIIGLPRNDSLAHYSLEHRKKIRAKLGIELNSIAILYAPTYREYHRTSNGIQLSLPIDLHKWEEKLGKTHTLLLRAHYSVTKVMNITENSFVHNVSDYPLLEDLMIASDILISDYSSMFFDYSIMGKPMICFAFDYEEYAKKRGLYFDIREKLMSVENETELLNLLLSFDYEGSREKAKRFREEFVTAYGNATKESLDIIADELNLR